MNNHIAQPVPMVLRLSGQLERSAWYYPEPSQAARVIKDRVAFRHGVKAEPGA